MNRATRLRTLAALSRVGIGELSLESPNFEMMNDEAATNIVEAAETSSKKGIFERLANAFAMVPFTIITNLFAAFCTVNSSNSFGLTPFSFHSLVFIVMLNFYTSIIGIVLWQVFPMVARGNHLMAFLCALLSFTILCGAILPIQLNGVPWIFMALVVLIYSLILSCFSTNSPFILRNLTSSMEWMTNKSSLELRIEEELWS